MFDYGSFSFDSKEQLYAKAREFWNPGKVDFWRGQGIDLVIDRREGYFLYDIAGRRLIDLHINGGTFNFGHRHPELVETLKLALDHFDIGNHWFPSAARTALAEEFIKVSPGMDFCVFGAGGAEAVELAIKSARYATKRRRIVSIIKGYHGHSGLSVATGDDRFSKIFLADRPEEFAQIPFRDLGALETELKKGDVAAFILETIPATYGFPMPSPEYLKGCVELCRKYDVMYIADEVQTGLMRTGHMWGWQAYGIKPDIFVSAKGISGGIYPISVACMTERCAAWQREDGAAHITTAGGSELGCVVGLKVLEMLQRPEVVANVHAVAQFFAEGLSDIQGQNSDIFGGIRQKGVILGLEFNHPEGAVYASRALYEHGVWAIFSSLDKRILQFKPGVLLDAPLCEEILDRFSAAMPLLRQKLASAPRHS
jgi:acetylornithine/succinyldiaminopimelate/putrescine aminotransferase